MNLLSSRRFRRWSGLASRRSKSLSPKLKWRNKTVLLIRTGRILQKEKKIMHTSHIWIVWKRRISSQQQKAQKWLTWLKLEKLERKMRPSYLFQRQIFLLPGVYLHWQVITLSHLQSMQEDIINEVLVWDSYGMPSWKHRNYQNHMLNFGVLQTHILWHSPHKTSLRPSSASFSVTSVLIARPLRYATILLNAKTVSATV